MVVEYGTSTSYGSQSASAGVGSGSANVAVSRALSGLAAGTTYHYRVVATNGAGTSRGADGIFTTLAAPVVATSAATGVTPTSATLNGSVDPNGRATTWYFEYGTSTRYGTKTAGRTPAPAAARSVSRPPWRTSPAAAPTTSGSSRRAMPGRAAAPTGPSRRSERPRVTTDAASSVTPTSARLNGTITPNGQATSWYFDYGTTTSYGTRTPVRSAGSGTGATRVNTSVTRLRTGVTYHYRLVATNASGTTVGRDRAFSTRPAAGRPHRRGAGRDRDDRDAGRLGRPARTVDELVVRVRHYDGLRLPDASRSAGSGGAARAVSAAVSGLRPGTTYHYRLVARNDAGTTRGANASFTTVGRHAHAPRSGSSTAAGSTLRDGADAARR